MLLQRADDVIDTFVDYKAVELAGESIDGRQIRIDYAGQKKEGNGGGNTWQKKW